MRVENYYAQKEGAYLTSSSGSSSRRIATTATRLPAGLVPPRMLRIAWPTGRVTLELHADDGVLVRFIEIDPSCSGG